MSHRPYPNVDRALHQLDRGRTRPRPTALQKRLAKGARSALKLAGQSVQINVMPRPQPTFEEGFATGLRRGRAGY